MNSASFCDLVCDAFKCAPEDYSDVVLWLCIFPQSILLARILWLVNRDFFTPDLELIRSIGYMTNADEIRAEIQDFRYRTPPQGFLRNALHVRISGQRMLNLAEKLFTKTSPP